MTAATKRRSKPQGKMPRGTEKAPAHGASILDTGRTLFTPDEIQREFRLSRATTYRLLVGYAGHPPVIPSVRLGRQLRIPRSVVEKIVSGELPMVEATT